MMRRNSRRISFGDGGLPFDLVNNEYITAMALEICMVMVWEHIGIQDNSIGIEIGNEHGIRGIILSWLIEYSVSRDIVRGRCRHILNP